ncbi:hypothetical protein HAX54_022381, partial [Datura stramonium]|nr:hypothetical protein [Datura stramonium]
QLWKKEVDHSAESELLLERSRNLYVTTCRQESSAPKLRPQHNIAHICKATGWPASVRVVQVI